MKAKRLIILTLVFSMIFAATVYADSLHGIYDGYPIAKVLVNGSEIKIDQGEVPGLVIDGTTVLPLRKVAESLQAIVKWDSSTLTANIYKPNVHLFVSEDTKITGNDNKDYLIKAPFGRIAQGKTTNVFVNAQVDTLIAKTSGFKIRILTPSGDEYDSKEISKDFENSFWFTCSFKVKFSQAGTYLVDFSFKGDDGNYVTVSQKTIVSE
jgi:hypothetical protein